MVRASRARRGARRLLTRVLPGGVMVAAALTLPEFSVGAGDTGRGPAAADPPEPSSYTGLDRAKHGSGAAKGPLAGVRYGALIDVRAATPSAKSRSPAAVLDSAATSGEDRLPQPGQLAARPAARATGPAPRTSGVIARPIDAGRISPKAVEELDRAATYAVSVLSDFTAPPGLPIDTALAARTVTPSAEIDPLDRAAQYSASVIETFVENAAPRPATAIVAPAQDGGALSASDPALTPALTDVAASAPLQTVTAAPPPAPVSAAAASQPVPEAAAAPAPRPAPVALTPASPARSKIEQVTPARSAAARAAADPVVAPPAARAPVAAASAKPASAPAPAALAAVLPKPAPALTAPASAAALHVAAPAFNARLFTRIDGRASGEVDFQQTAAGLKVRLGSIAELLAERIPASELARIRCSGAGNAWLSLAELQAQGIPISYDPVYDEFNIGREDARPRAARKVHIDQISAPQRRAGAVIMDQILRR